MQIYSFIFLLAYEKRKQVWKSGSLEVWKYWITGTKAQTVNCQLSAINRQRPTANRQPPTANRHRQSLKDPSQQ